MEKPPSKSTARELVEQAGEAAAGMIPILGSPAAVAFAFAMGLSHNRRMAAWYDAVAVAITDLQTQLDGFTIENLAEDAEFVDAVVAASRAAQTTSSQEKLDALRNGLLNSLRPDASGLDERLRFFRLVEQFTPTHLRLLLFLDDPGKFFDTLGLARPDIYMGGRGSLLASVPEFSGSTEWLALAVKDLDDASLTNHGGLNVTQSGASLWQSATSPLGRRFLAFIRDPRDGPSDATS